MKKAYRIFIFLLFPLSIFINEISAKYPYLVEKYYTRKINKFIVQLLSKLSGILSFSIYEVLIYILILFLFTFIFYALYLYIKNKSILLKFLKSSLINFLSVCSITYFLFIILWGLNYNKLPLEYILINQYSDKNNKNLSSINYNLADLKELYSFLVEKANESRSLVLENNGIMKYNTNYKETINRASLRFESISNIIPNLNGDYSNAKYIFSSNLMCYTGITGIYFH